jgi:hypothetical protein
MDCLTTVDINFVIDLLNRLPSSISLGAALCGIQSDVITEYYTDDEIDVLKSLFTGSFAMDYPLDVRQALDRVSIV